MGKSVESQDTGKSGKKRERRGRVFAFLVYPDSSYPDWQERLKNEHVRGFISPCHDKDLLVDGSPKKAHWHVVLFFDGKKSKEQIDEIRTRAIGPDFSDHVEEVSCAGAYSRYLIHLDNPEKAQYRREDVICLGGADYDLASSSRGDDTVRMSEISAYVVSHDITSVNRLIALCKGEGRKDWLTYISEHGYVIGMIIGHNTKRLQRIRTGEALPGDYDVNVNANSGALVGVSDN